MAEGEVRKDKTNSKIKMQNSKLQLKNENWRKAKLEEVLDLIIDHRGKTPKKLGGTWAKSGIPALSAKNIKDGQIVNKKDIRYVSEELYEKWMPEKLEAGDILMTSEAPLGELFHLKESSDYCLSQRLFALRTNKKILDSRFLYYYLQSPKGRYELSRRRSGTAAEGIKQSELRKVEVYFPNSLNEQRRIAEILSAFDEKIELNNKINQILEEMAQAIFKEWLLKNQKSKIKNQRIRDLTEITSGYPFKSKLYTKSQKGTLGVVTIKNVQDGDFITHCDSFIKKEEVPENMNSECFIKNSDILLSLTGNVGRVCFVYGEDYLLNQRVAKIKPINQKDRALVYFLFRQKSMQSLLINMAKGSAQPNLSPVETGEIEINLPSRDVLDKFAEIVNPIYDYFVQNKAENQKLSALRDALLPKLMSGEVRV